MTKDLNNEDKYWQQLKSENYNKTFPKVETWVNNLNSENNYNFKSNKIQLNRIQIMKNFFALNKFKLVFSTLLLAVIFAACTVPVTQNEIIGNALNWKVSKNSTEAINKISSLPWIDRSKLSVLEQTEGERTFLDYNLVLEAKSDAEIKNYMRQLQDIKDIATVNIFPLNQTTKRPLYAAALHSFFRIDVDATNMSDAEVNAELERQLKEAGIETITVDFKKNAKGERMLEIHPTEGGLKAMEDITKDKDFELSVKDGNNKQFIKTRQKHEALNLEGKTDDEIKKVIIEDMKKNGTDIKLEDLKIERDAEGHVKVEFTKVNDSKDGKMQNKIELKIK
jgi:hypothetical protein